MYDGFVTIFKMVMLLWPYWGPPFLIFAALTVFEIVFTAATKE